MPIEFASRRGRTVLAATILASGVAFLDATVVTVALPRIGTDLGADLAALQWVLDAYLLALGGLVLVGGALGDVLGRRRVFLAGVGGFGAASLLCALAWSPGVLIGGRAVQGVFAALLTPASLAILSSSFSSDQRGRAIGAWSGLAGIATAVGPFVGGWLVDSVSWRWIFLLNIPLLAGAAEAARRAVPASGRSPTRHELRTRVDLPGAALAVAGLALIVTPLIEFAHLPPALVTASLAAGVAALGALVVHGRRRPSPMVPPGLFRIRTIAVANLVTVTIYAALTGASFLVTFGLQRALGYSALEAGAALVPLTLVLLVFSARVGAVLPRVGARPLLTAGSLLMAAGLVLLSRVEVGSVYLTGVLPGVLVMAAGLVLVVAPVTTTALADAPPSNQGVASGVNNAVARVAGLIAVAVLPAAAGIAGTDGLAPEPLLEGVSRAMLILAVTCAVGALIAWIGLRPCDARKAQPDPRRPASRRIP